MFKNLSVILFMFIYVSPVVELYAQGVYSRVLGSGSRDDHGIIREIDGELFMLGYIVRSSMEVGVVAKLDDDLNFEWHKLYEVTTKDRVMDIARMADGRYLLSMTGNGGSSFTHALISETGNVQWAKNMGVYHDRIHFLLPTSDGGFLAFGELEGKTNGRHNTMAVIKYDASLNVLWHSMYDYYGTPDYDSEWEMYSSDAEEMDDGSIVMLGRYTAIRSANRDRKVRLLKISASGELLWVKGFQGGQMDLASSLLVTDDGNIMVTGYTSSFGGGHKVFLAQLSESGDLQWIKTYGTTENYTVRDLKAAPGGGYIIAGSRNLDAMLMKVSIDGSFEWGHTYSGEGEEVFDELIVRSNGYLASGTTDGHNSSVYKDIFIVQTDENGISAGCRESFSPQVQNVSVSTFSGMFNRTSFSLPTAIGMSQGNFEMTYSPACSECPEDRYYTINLCQGESSQIDLSEFGVEGYNWDNGSIDASRRFDQAGAYWVEVKMNDICTYTLHYQVSVVSDNLSIDLGEDQTICKGETFRLEVDTTAAESIVWQDGSTEGHFTVREAGTYYVTLENSCMTYSDTLIVSYTNPVQVEFPNVITPNGDDKNEHFIIDSSLEGSRIAIFNKWGKEVYLNENYLNNWSGKGLPSGAYFYEIYNACTDMTYKGWLHILK